MTAPAHSHHTPHDAESGHDNPHEHSHSSPGSSSLLSHIKETLIPHGHDLNEHIDPPLEANRIGNQALIFSLLGLGVTAAIQIAIFSFSSSVSLFGDALHNAADALTALPLAVAFFASRRPPTTRYTYGFGRAEDLAGAFIIFIIAISAALSASLAITRFIHPVTVTHLHFVALAALIGVAGNELVAQYRIKIGRRIGSAALVADGHHARADGFASLAVLVGAGGVALGFPLADPIVGLVITCLILVVLFHTTRSIYRRLMDAVDPLVLAAVSTSLSSTAGVIEVGELRLRWIGHSLRAECAIIVDSSLSLCEAHAISLTAEHSLLHDVPRLRAALVHADPADTHELDHHSLTRHHA